MTAPEFEQGNPSAAAKLLSAGALVAHETK